MAINVNIGAGRVKTFRGKQMEELKNLDVREFAKLLTSREKRTIMRSFQVLEKFLEKSKKDVAKGKMPKTQLRELPIVPIMIGWTVGIHNGKEYTPIKIVEEMLGHRLGEFALTRKPVKHGAAGIGATRGSASLSVK
jgi:small subunit ribosomal protein S19